MPNMVTLTFAGESKDLENTFNRVGESSQRMSRQVSDSTDSFKKAGQAADEVDTKAMGFRDALTGVQDTALGTSEIMKGNLFEGFLLLGAGIGDLGSAFYNLIIPAFGKLSAALKLNVLWTNLASAATKVWTGIQTVFNAVMAVNPAVLVTIAIIALIAVIVLIATKTDWFQRLWRVAWSGIRAAAENTWNFLRKIPGWISSAFSKVASSISAPFRAAFNFISDAWNNTIGALHWSVPGWVPGIGGNSISTPRLPHFHSGGVVPGTPGSELLAVLQAGETVVPAGRAQTVVVEVSPRPGADSRFMDWVVNNLNYRVRTGQGVTFG